ncbi:hypothetical protein [Thalassospira sp. MCCC 1A01428]|uniref:hypothetical protein n=1 Tax=Thalassospira sp. MCCC 1A01428 TaxID=1470575 RepID=UPI000A1F435F|nr:hypothetical protein [Thalassospira sp. MCCC 1A01428]OSQ43120.1 hypothetical protein THS27_12080 [Thalassospira sp. MCCC 1A01428]
MDIKISITDKFDRFLILNNVIMRLTLREAGRCPDRILQTQGGPEQNHNQKLLQFSREEFK